MLFTWFGSITHQHFHFRQKRLQLNGSIYSSWKNENEHVDRERASREGAIFEISLAESEGWKMEQKEREKRNRGITGEIDPLFCIEKGRSTSRSPKRRGIGSSPPLSDDVLKEGNGKNRKVSPTRKKKHLRSREFFG